MQTGGSALPDSKRPGPARDRRVGLVCALLLGLVLWVYWPALSSGFINYDDETYVTGNPHVQAGLTANGLLWAVTRLHGEGTYWHPLTWVSHMLDCQLYGLKPWGHHLTNVLLHACNSLLVFFLFRRMAGALWPCALLAALFAVHPLQVDTVAWVAERKNLLSALFWLLTTWAYVRYAEHPRLNRYALVLVLFALGLMCKPVLVTLPFVLLLLDYWPLRRFQPAPGDLQISTFGRLAWEKMPLFLLAAASSALTIVAHRSLGLLAASPARTLDCRVENALVSYARYLGKAVWPSKLAIFYPYPEAWPLWQIGLSALLLGAVSIMAVTLGGLWTYGGRARHSVRATAPAATDIPSPVSDGHGALWSAHSTARPWLLVGWLWFLGVLVPFIGLVQAGDQAMADRFMYVPLLGLLLLCVWGSCDLAEWCRLPWFSLIAAALAAITVCAAVAHRQAEYWKNSEVLFRHAVAVTEDNALAHNNLGSALLSEGRPAEAVTQFQIALQLKPDNTDLLNNLACALSKQGLTNEAFAQLQRALALDPNRADTHYNLGSLLLQTGRTEEGLAQYQAALRLNPTHAQAQAHLGAALLRQQRLDEAIVHLRLATTLAPSAALARAGQLDGALVEFRQALRLEPADASTRCALGIVLGRLGRLDEAVAELAEAVRLQPDNPAAHCNLGITLGKQGRLGSAIAQLTEAVRLQPDNAEAHCDLGIIFGMTGNLDDAITHLNKALQLKPDYPAARNNLQTALDQRAAQTNQPSGASSGP